MTYGALFRTILSDYPGADFILGFPDKAIGRLLVQYEETDWAFLKRVASEIYMPLAAIAGGENIQIYAGVPQVENSLSSQLERVGKKISEVRKFAEQGATEPAFTQFHILSDSCHQLFETVSYDSMQLTIQSMHWTLVRGILECRYVLQQKAGILEYPIYPVSLVGIALAGRILAVRGNQVQIHMDIDDPYGGPDVYWFPYATMSASLDGSGWYYMPEVGDRVRVEFPTKHAEESLVINSADEYTAPSGGGTDQMANPAVKYLSNVHGQNMSMGPKGVSISCAGGSSSVTVGADGCIVIWGDSEIIVKAENKITVTSKEITLKGGDKLKEANEEGTGAEFKSELDLTGAEIFMN